MTVQFFFLFLDVVSIRFDDTVCLLLFGPLLENLSYGTTLFCPKTLLRGTPVAALRPISWQNVVLGLKHLISNSHVTLVNLNREAWFTYE